MHGVPTACTALPAPTAFPTHALPPTRVTCAARRAPPARPVPQMMAMYYMRHTGMDEDAVERATCRDTFITPEQAVDNGERGGRGGGRGCAALCCVVLGSWVLCPPLCLG